MASPGWGSPNRGCISFGKKTCKPNSVVCGHSSRRRVAADTHQRPTRRFRPLRRVTGAGAAFRRRAGTECASCSGRAASLPIWSCSVWGLPCLRLYSRSGALLPHHFTLTPALAVRAEPFGSSPRPGPERPVPRRYIFCGTGRPWALRPTSRTLSGTLPCGVRTFLPRTARVSKQSGSDRPVLLPVFSLPRKRVSRRLLPGFHPSRAGYAQSVAANATNPLNRLGLQNHPFPTGQSFIRSN